MLNFFFKYLDKKLFQNIKSFFIYNLHRRIDYFFIVILIKIIYYEGD